MAYKQKRIFSTTGNNKGLWCPFKPILCQEGYCIGCQIYLERNGKNLDCHDNNGNKGKTTKQEEQYGDRNPFNSNREQPADNVRQVGVQIYMLDQICTGYIYCPRNGRLLDTLNGTAAGELYADTKFLCINSPEKVYGDTGGLSARPFQINKDNILFIIEFGDWHTRGLGETSGFKPYPFLSKVTQMIKLHLPSYTLVGKTHHLDGQQIYDVLDPETRFMPMTDVEIVSDQGAGIPKVDFVAVNKEQIIYLEEI